MQNIVNGKRNLTRITFCLNKIKIFKTGKVFVVVLLRISSQSKTAGRRQQQSIKPHILLPQQSYQNIESKEWCLLEDLSEQEVSGIAQAFDRGRRRKIAR